MGSVEMEGIRHQRGKFPAGPDVHFHIELDVRNNSPGLIILHGPKLIQFDMGTPLFVEEPSLIQYKLLNPPHGHKPIAFPLSVESDTRPRLGVQVTVRHNFRSEEYLAAHLRELGQYCMSFTYEYEDMTRHVEGGRVTVEGSLEDYACRLAQDWTHLSRISRLTYDEPSARSS